MNRLKPFFLLFATGYWAALSGYDRDTTLPTVIITDEMGKIIFLDPTDNYRIRPEPKSFIAAIG